MSLNPLDIYARASRRLKLTPGERALLRTADTLVLAGLAGGAVAVGQALLDGGQPLSLATLGHVFLYAAATALLTGVAKLFRASGDTAFTAMGNAIEGVASRLPAPQQQSQPQQIAPSGFMPRAGTLSGPLNAPRTDPELARQQRLAALTGSAGSAGSGGYRRFGPGGSVGDPSTQPTQAIPPAGVATSEPRTPVLHTPVSSPVLPPAATPAPSQAQSPSADDENGPPTQEMPASNAVTAAKQDSWAR